MSVSSIAGEVSFKSDKEKTANLRNTNKTHTRINSPQPDYKGSIIVAASVSGFVETLKIIINTSKDVSKISDSGKNLFKSIFSSIKPMIKPAVISFAAWTTIFSITNCAMQYFLFGRNK